ncbi:MAG TPA: PhzF family phenazine biosynthesis protein [Kiloniellales bacterium]|nr:PhzF family phenazine biosynthesis protein [Kiloniellales bacterium]
MKLPLYQIDAFTHRVFGGNPAAVCPLERWLADETLQAIAAENNLAETAFLVERPDGDFDLRWFTPKVEVDLCGHATLAGAEVVFSRLRQEASKVRFHSRSGPLTVTREGELLTMDFPAQPPRKASAEEAAAVAAALGSIPLEVWREEKFLALLPDEAAVRRAAPNLAKVAALPGDGLIVSARGEQQDFVSRYFAPAFGIDEDAVTGSAHCVLTPFWVERLQRNPLRARQVSQRGGDLLCRLEGARVFLSGRAVLYLEGSITI